MPRQGRIGQERIPQRLKSLRESREFACSPAGTAKDSVMSAVPPGLFVLSDPTQDYVPISANLFGIFFFKAPTKSSS